MSGNLIPQPTRVMDRIHQFNLTDLGRPRCPNKQQPTQASVSSQFQHVLGPRDEPKQVLEMSTPELVKLDFEVRLYVWIPFILTSSSEPRLLGARPHLKSKFLYC